MANRMAGIDRKGDRARAVAWAQATALHHITNAMVRNAPGFDLVWPDLKELLTSYEVVIYNAAFDTRLVAQSAKPYGIKVPTFRTSCAMLNYAAFLGDWNDYRQSYTWPKLIGGDHSAIGDCRATLEVIMKMASAP
jgi:DNA polymerase III subunit epsilon